ncbi:MAG: hypothetical protein DRR19_01630 [Candidatus Parabeggiatoa sp. nov. 1]|nr:MAG: hypothetical protein DRR19_01630 [Gammaproteobacteria bacterium]
MFSKLTVSYSDQKQKKRQMKHSVSRLTGILCLGAILTFYGCDKTKGTDNTAVSVVSDRSLLVSGHVEREFTDHTWNEEFVATDAAHVVIQVRRYEGEDVAAPLLAERDVPFKSLPFDFDVRVAPKDMPRNDEQLLISVNIYNHEGTEGAVGDLIDEYRNMVEPRTEEVKIIVSGLESCDDPNAGGFCTGQ